MCLKKLLVVGISVVIFVGCTNQSQEQAVQKDVSNTEMVVNDTSDHEEEGEKNQEINSLYPAGEDVRVLEWVKVKEISEEGLSKELISSYWFNESTDFKSFESIADEIMEEGKNPGLGVRGLHEKGITGEGVNVAIIDQPIEVNHPEYKGKIVEYKNLCDAEGGISSMHGPSVASLLAGNTTGVAPGVHIYYVAAPSWTGDAAFQAEALNWIIERNRQLPEKEKIRVVSVSAAPSGEGSPFNKNNAQWDEAVLLAQQEGLLVLDCTETYGKIGSCYCNGDNKEDASNYKAGFPGEEVYKPSRELVCAPTGSRTMAETYNEGEYSYQYMEEGGLSWGIPYAAGTLALGWQVNPNLTPDEIMTLLFETATVSKEGYKIINPVNFVETIQSR